ncbi:TolB family protein [Cohnella caldifontis]|uniref:TolB family protein n=1 Tax=Cohnella caldifontis TaxID=3027471 RepID=UPI0023EC4CAE|nr:hypothetical protein [Cohnella sp. YIM B05605]
MSWKKSMAAAALAATLGVTAVTGAFAAETVKTGSASLLPNVDHVQWLDADRLIASQLTEQGRTDYILDLAAGKYELLLDAAGASDLALSPNGSKAAYTDESGAVYVLDLATKTSKRISQDTNIKPELTWSSDGASLYFLQGDKGTVINRLEVDSGAIVKVLDDKKDYKANLAVSMGGKRFTYTLTVPPVVTAPSDKPVEEDAVAIDDSKASQNIYQYVNDPEVKDGNPAALTNTGDDKVFVGAEPFGAESYFISTPAGEGASSKLVSVSIDGKVKTLFANRDVYMAKYAGGMLYALTSGPSGRNQIYAISPVSGESQLLTTVNGTTSTFEVNKNGTIAIETDGKFYVDLNGSWVQITQ